MKKTSILRLALTAMLLLTAALATSTARAECGGCGGKKEAPAPSPVRPSNRCHPFVMPGSGARLDSHCTGAAPCALPRNFYFNRWFSRRDAEAQRDE